VKYFDTHCHIDFSHFDRDREEVIKRAKDMGVVYIVDVGIDVETTKKAIELAEKYEFIYASAGIHPSEVNNSSENALNEMETLAKNKKVVAIGETGLDYHYSGIIKEKQKEFFKAQIEIARKLNLPLIIHQRESKEDLIKILEESDLPEKIVFHCFGGDGELAKYCEERGFYISFTGIVTFKNALKVKEVAKNYPVEKIMAETDAPFLSPHPFRGKRNEPMFVKYIIKEIAELKGVNLEKISEIIFTNSLHFFNLNLLTPGCEAIENQELLTPRVQ